MRLSLLALFSLYVIFCAAQNRSTFDIDSLQKVVANTKLPDSSRLAALHDIARSYIYTKPDTVYVLARRELQFAQQSGNKRYEANAHTNMGISRYCLSHYDEALAEYRTAVHIWDELASGSLGRSDKQRIAILYNNIGNVFKSLGDYPQSLEYHFKSLQIKESIGDSTGMAASIGNLGVLYENMGDHQRAVEQYFRCLDLFAKLGDSTGISSSYSNIGNVYESLRDYRNALKYENMALVIKYALGEVYGLANTYNSMGIIYEGLHRPDSAMLYHQMSLDAYDRAGDEQGVAIALNNIGRVLIAQHKYREAEKNLLQSLALAEKLETPEDVRDASYTLSIAYDKMGDFGKALFYFRKYVASRDSVSNEENTKRAVRTEMNYNFAKKEAIALAEQEKKEAIAGADRRRQKIILMSVSSLGILVLIFAFFAWRSYRLKRKANDEISAQKRLIEEKQKAVLDSIHYAKRIQQSLMPNEKYLEKILLHVTKKI